MSFIEQKMLPPAVAEALPDIVHEAQQVTFALIGTRLKILGYPATGDVTPGEAEELDRVFETFVRMMCRNTSMAELDEWPPFKVGDRVKLKRDAERFPHFIARAGMTGTVVTVEGKNYIPECFMAVRMDVKIVGAESWDNEVQWFEGTGDPLDDLELLPF